MKYIISIVITAFLISCGENKPDIEQYMVDISEFKIDTTYLKDGEKVKVIGASNKLTEDDKIDFYTLVVVQSLKTGKKINVLTTSYFFADQKNTVLTYMSNRSKNGLIMENMDNLGGKNINDLKPKKFTKVFYDTEFIQTDVRGLPTVIGNIGEVTINKAPKKIEQPKAKIEKPKIDTIQKSEFWTLNKIASAELYVYAPKFSEEGFRAHLIEDNKLNSTIIDSFTTQLNSAQIKLLEQNLLYETNYLDFGADCFNPHHGLIIKDSNGKVLRCYSICFECSNYSGVEQYIPISFFKQFFLEHNLPIGGRKVELIYRRNHPESKVFEKGH